MCEYVDLPNIAPGFACCFCRSYNALHYAVCRCCRKQRCRPLSPDPATGASFERVEDVAPPRLPKLSILKTLTEYV